MAVNAGRAVLVAVLAALWCAPADAERVARSGELTLHARQGDGRMCITLKRAGRYQGQACGRIPRSPHRPLRMFPDVGFSNYAAAVAASVRTAETESRRGKRARHRTFSAPGFAARFALIPAPPSAVFVRYYDAGGTLLGVDGGPAGYIGFEHETAVSGDVERGVDAHTEPQLAPLPGDPGRLRTIGCVSLRYALGGAEACDDRAGTSIALSGACGESALLGGVAPASVASLRLTLGSGAEVAFPVRALPAAFGGRHAIAGDLPRGEAVRDAAALDATGTVVARTAVGTPPGGQPCGGEDQGDDGTSVRLAPVMPPPGAATVASAGGVPLLAADQGDRLCVQLGALTARICPPPPVDADRPRLLRRGGVVAVALGGDAARVTLALERGGTVTARTTDGAAYAGRWAGAVRFFAAAVGDRDVTRVVVRDARGAIVGVGERGIARVRVRRTTLAERAGLGLRLVRRRGQPACLAASAAALPPAPAYCTDLDPGTPIDGPAHPHSGAVAVACAPRAAIAYGRMPDRYAAPRVVLDGGRTVRTRRVALRGEDAWVAFLPDAPVRGFRSRAGSVALALPPASAQCGYAAARSF